MCISFFFCVLFADNLYETFWQMTVDRMAEFSDSNSFPKSKEQHRLAKTLSDKLNTMQLAHTPLLAFSIGSNLEQSVASPKIDCREKDASELYERLV